MRDKEPSGGAQSATPARQPVQLLHVLDRLYSEYNTFVAREMKCAEKHRTTAIVNLTEASMVVYSGNKNRISNTAAQLKIQGLAAALGHVVSGVWTKRPSQMTPVRDYSLESLHPITHTHTHTHHAFFSRTFRYPSLKATMVHVESGFLLLSSPE